MLIIVREIEFLKPTEGPAFGIRKLFTALCHESLTARLSREHNDSNVLCLGARVLGVAIALDVVRAWLATDFAGGRHLRRISMMG